MFDLTNLFHSFYINFLQALEVQLDDGEPTNSGSIQTSQSNGPSSALAERLMNEAPNFATNQPSNLYTYMNTVLAQSMQQSKEWHASVTPDLRNHLVHKL